LLDPLERANFNHWTACIEVEVILQLSVNQSVSVGVEHSLGPMTRYLFLIDSYCLVSCEAPSLMRGWVCHLSVHVSSDESILSLNVFAFAFKFKLSYDARLVGQSLLVSGYHLGPTNNISFSP
jgi:hypothetical protein